MSRLSHYFLVILLIGIVCVPQSYGFSTVPLVVVTAPIAIRPAISSRRVVTSAALFGATSLVRSGNSFLAHHPSFSATLTGSGWNLQSRTFCFNLQGTQTGFFNGAQELAPTTDFGGGFDVADYASGINPSSIWSGGVFGQTGGKERLSPAFNCTNNYSIFIDGPGLFNLTVLPTTLADVRQAEINHLTNQLIALERGTGIFFKHDILAPNPNFISFVQSVPIGGGQGVSGLAEIPGSNRMVYAVNPSAITTEVHRFSVTGAAADTVLFNAAALQAHTGLSVSKITAITADTAAVYVFESFSDRVIRFDLTSSQFSTVATGQLITLLDGTLQPNVVDMDVELRPNGTASNLYLLTSGSLSAGGAAGAILDLPQ